MSANRDGMLRQGFIVVIIAFFVYVIVLIWRSETSVSTKMTFSLLAFTFIVLSFLFLVLSEALREEEWRKQFKVLLRYELLRMFANPKLGKSLGTDVYTFGKNKTLPC